METWTGAGQRMRDKILPVLLKDSRYAERLPIGKVEVVGNCEYETLRRFYKEWYRPEMMALIVVGDVNVDDIETKIKEQFSDLKTTDNARNRDVYDVPDHEETLVAIVTDPEASHTVIEFNHKFEKREDKTVAGFLEQLRTSLYTGMLNMLYELTQQPEPPYINGGVYYGQALTRSTEAYVGQIVVAAGGIEKGFTAFFSENKRAAEGGFTEAELVCAKANMMSGFERQYAEREKTESSRFASQYVSHFLQATPTPSISFQYDVVKQYLDQIQLCEVNTLAERLKDSKNRVFMVTGPESIKGEISEERILELIKEVEQKKVEAYVEEEIASELVPHLPPRGKVVSIETIESVDVKHLVLSNGVNVYLKKTDFKNDEVLFEGWSFGGSSLTDLEDKYSVAHADSIIAASGWGEFSALDLSKFLAGKPIRVQTVINDQAEVVRAGCRPQDLEEVFQLLHLVFTSQRKDEAAYSSMMTRMEGY